MEDFENLAASPRTTADQLYRMGNDRRRAGDWQGAINCYLEAEERDPHSPAAEARMRLMEILEYRNNDLYNP